MKKVIVFTNIKTFICIAALLLTVSAELIICNSGFSQPPQMLSSTKEFTTDTVAVNGAILLDTRCSTCHGSDKAKGTKKTSAQWEKTVTRMIWKGAKLTEDEKTVLLDYLVKEYDE
ncbi:MAG: hypothetical protein JW882_02730 [Deltaproteobacteria bacterium]|nr:hypothetical protein [Deltaproteobacteria bacterium]